jgi:hypothetical protein
MTVSAFYAHMYGHTIRIRKIRDALHATAVFLQKRAYEQSSASKSSIFMFCNKLYNVKCYKSWGD